MLAKYIASLKVGRDGNFHLCCCEMLLHVNRWKNRKKGNSVKILMSLCHDMAMLIRRCTWNELGRCKGWWTKENEEWSHSMEECREKFGGRRNGSLAKLVRSVKWVKCICNQQVEQGEGASIEIQTSCLVLANPLPLKCFYLIYF